MGRLPEASSGLGRAEGQAEAFPTKKFFSEVTHWLWASKEWPHGGWDKDWSYFNLIPPTRSAVQGAILKEAQPSRSCHHSEGNATPGPVEKEGRSCRRRPASRERFLKHTPVRPKVQLPGASTPECPGLEGSQLTRILRCSDNNRKAQAAPRTVGRYFLWLVKDFF